MIDGAVKTRGIRGIACEGLQNFQVAQRGGIECEKFAVLIKNQPMHMRDITPKGVYQIVERPTGGANGGGAVFQAEPVERFHTKMIAQRVLRGVGGKDPILVFIENDAAVGQGFGEGGVPGRIHDFRWF